jgi:hypothetical protein
MRNRKIYVQTPIVTLTLSALLPVLLQRQRRKAIECLDAALRLSMDTRYLATGGARCIPPSLAGYFGEALAEPFHGTLEFLHQGTLWLIKSTHTPSFGNRFTTISRFNIRNGFSQTARRRYVISTNSAS